MRSPPWSRRYRTSARRLIAREQAGGCPSARLILECLSTAEGKSMIEFVCSTVAHSSARATCVFHFLDQPREVSLGPLLQFIYRVVAVVDADLF